MSATTVLLVGTVISLLSPSISLPHNGNPRERYPLASHNVTELAFSSHLHMRPLIEALCGKVKANWYALYVLLDSGGVPSWSRRLPTEGLFRVEMHPVRRPCWSLHQSNWRWVEVRGDSVVSNRSLLSGRVNYANSKSVLVCYRTRLTVGSSSAT